MRAAKEGVAKLVATASSGRTRLTTVSHRAPARLLPVRAALADDAGSAICALGSYGGGLLGGDRVVLEVHARHGSTLTVGNFRNDTPLAIGAGARRVATGMRGW